MKISVIGGCFFTRALLAVLLLCLSGWVMAQNEQQMQQMMEMAQKAQACMANIDRGQLNEMASNAKQMEAEIKQLCSSGKRTEAQNIGMKYGMEMSQSAVAKEMRKCSEMMSGALAGMGSSIMPGMGFPDVKDMEDTHICDAY